MGEPTGDPGVAVMMGPTLTTQQRGPLQSDLPAALGEQCMASPRLLRVSTARFTLCPLRRMDPAEGQRRFPDSSDEDDDGDVANLANLYTAIKGFIVGQYSDSEDEGADPDVGDRGDSVSLEMCRWKKRAFIFGVCLMFQVSISFLLLRLMYNSYILRAQQEAALRGEACADCGPVVSAASFLARPLAPSMRTCCLQPGAWLLSFLLPSGPSASVSQLTATGAYGGAPQNLSEESFVYLKDSPGGEEKLLPGPEDPLHSGQTREEEPSWGESPTDPIQEEPTCETGEELSRSESGPDQEESHPTGKPFPPLHTQQ
ncbi:hypothetical protein NDU88_000212 [Pleurodeles waltl]|uniref:Uncharacterized protein n=1 Tax=Pleurodeles waltl TaxID=8319 RepID=A0AAV7V676_PLEWA|nr:hypothetical protein NDU88_000212 [Pleurodeles waltl]